MRMGFSNVVRFLVKEGSQKDFEDVFDTFAVNDGENAGYLIKTGDSEYIYVGIVDAFQSIDTFCTIIKKKVKKKESPWHSGQPKSEQQFCKSDVITFVV